MSHVHCEGCVSRHCAVKADYTTSCPMAVCEVGCGARFHQCLQSEHSSLCPDERVACINFLYGCPLVMQRKKLGIHLEVCPASVLCCPIEWNRWPMYSVEDKKKMPLPSNILKVHCGQLDVALAMRDQRMLVETLNAPKKTKRILRNRLTTRYPAAPFSHRSSSMESDMLTSEETSRNVSDDEGGNTPWNLGNYPPGLQRSVCSRLIRATKQTAECLSTTLDLASNHMANSSHSLKNINETSEQGNKKTNQVPSEQSNPMPDVSRCDNTEEPVDTDSLPPAQDVDETATTNNNNKHLTRKLDNDTRLCDVLGVDINIDCITKYQPKPPEMFTFLCAQEFRRDEYAWHFKNVHNDIQSCLNGWMEQRCPLAYLGCTFSFRRFQPSKHGVSIVHSALLESYGLAETVESNVSITTKVQCDKPESDDMDTNCLTQNVSPDCEHNNQTPVNEYDYDHHLLPRVQYKTTTTSQHSVESESTSDCAPKPAGDHLDMEVFTSYRAYSPISVQSRLSKPDAPAWNDTGMEFLKLPFEVLQHIARHLDSFSLCNLALTCKLLRDICCSLLDERGIVIQVWEKVKDAEQKVTWQSYCNRWRFSTAFSPVEQWQFSGHNPIGEHLKTCAFNQNRIIRDKPFFVYPPGDAPMDHELRSLLAERQRESVSVKLRELHQWYQQFQDVPEGGRGNNEHVMEN
ncbi:F-box only protein 30-like [Haliotis rubra]|uniref:F-box only protein 30-like n=1 Tax=Haliotis rubra TaxID=36100 RepID=UPI001EE5BA56|nr:F-box only protein 30-like [Haliotis rubra]